MSNRKKHQSRTPRHPDSGEYIFTNPREAAAFVRKMMAQGSQVSGTRAAMDSLGIQPHHYIHEVRKQTRSKTRKMPDAEAELLAQQTDEVAGAPPWGNGTSMPSSNPPNPRTRYSDYDPVTQRLYVEWGDGRTPYYYYDVTPQEADMFQNQVDSPGRYINAVLNFKNYGPVE